MNDKDIMRMMSEVGIEAVDPRTDTAQLLLESWILSAGKQIADAAQAEMKERCANVCEELPNYDDTIILLEAVCLIRALDTEEK